MFHLSLGLLLLFSGHLTSQVIQTNTNLTTVTDSTTAPTSPTLCYSNTCGGYPPIPWCVQTCPSNHTRCLALYSTDLQRGGVATPISFRCAYSEDGCGSSTCDPGIISEAGLFSCCCTGKLCNYVPAVVAMPSSADSAMCETFSCTDSSHCSHGYVTCSGPQACEATYRKNNKGTYSLISKQCKGSSSPVQCVPGQCVVETGSGNSTVSCCCYGDKCNVNVTFTVPSQVQPVSYLLSTCGSVGTMYILKGNPVCACPSGYVLGADQWTCLDINECSLDNGGCASGCVNTPGSYICTCQKDLGFFLADDGRSCISGGIFTPQLILPYSSTVIPNNSWAFASYNMTMAVPQYNPVRCQLLGDNGESVSAASIQWFQPDDSSVSTLSSANGSFGQIPVGNGLDLYSGYTANTTYSLDFYYERQPGMHRCVITDGNGVIYELYVGLYLYSYEPIVKRAMPTIPIGVQYKQLTAAGVDPPVFQLTCNSTGTPATIVQWTINDSLAEGVSYQTLRDPVFYDYENILIVTGNLSGLVKCNVTTWIAPDLQRSSYPIKSVSESVLISGSKPSSSLVSSSLTALIAFLVIGVQLFMYGEMN